jgi:hypothetical protein
MGASRLVFIAFNTSITVYTNNLYRIKILVNALGF